MNATCCPACQKGRLVFTARPVSQHADTIEVLATCDYCWFIFLHHFAFDEMLTEIAIEIEVEDAESRPPVRKPHLRLVKANN